MSHAAIPTATKSPKKGFRMPSMDTLMVSLAVLAIIVMVAILVFLGFATWNQAHAHTTVHVTNCYAGGCKPQKP